MSEEVSPEIIQSTQKLLGKHVTKPQLTEKLLRKPPFRFLHDVVNAVVRDSQFLKGFFTESELNSDNVKEREAKIAFLNKLITAVKTISGKDLQARASKIIAGLDATETNKLLQTIAKCIDDKVDTKQFVKDLKKGGKDAVGGTIKKATSKTSVPPKAPAEKLDSTRKKTNKEVAKKKPETGMTPKVTPKGASKVDTKKRLNAVEKTSSKSSVANKESKTSTKPGGIKPVAKKSSKVSSNGVASNASTPKSDTNSKSPRAQEKPSSPKVEPLEEESPGGEQLDSWRPQVMDEAAKLQNDADHQADVLGQDTVDAAPPLQEAEEDLKMESKDDIEKNDVEVEAPVRHPSARPKSARPRSGQMPSATLIPETVKPIMPSVKEFSLKDEVNVIKVVDEAKKAPPFRPKSSMLRPPSVRPSSARPGAPRLRPESTLPMKEIIPLGKINVIVENFDSAEMKDEDEEETVVIQSVPDDMPPEPSFLEKSLDIPMDKGHLVEQILEQIQGPDGALIDDVKGQLEWEHESMKGKDATTKEINGLRASIQSLTRTANPLGKLTSYLHEDVEAMHSELETWLNMKNTFTMEITKQKKINNESNQPLLNQLQNIEENIKKERDEIAAVKYNILKNEERIRQLVGKQITIE